jgi:5-methylthioadenosine/S-adenosylhomocysteine deaminase
MSNMVASLGRGWIAGGSVDDFRRPRKMGARAVDWLTTRGEELMCMCCDAGASGRAAFQCDAEAAGASRRTFLKASAGLALGATVSPMATKGAFAQPAQASSDLNRLQSSARILIRGAVVISMDRGVGDFASADVLIEGGKIREVRPGIAADPESTAMVDGRNRIVIPGFVDTHHHFYQGILRSILPDGLVRPDYMRDINDRLTAVYAPNDVHAGTLVTALGMIDMGTTCAVDTSQASHTPEHNDAGIRALQESGLRVVYGYSWGAGSLAQYPQDIGRLQRTYFTSRDQLLTLALSGSLNPKQFEAARAAGVPFVSHGVNNRTERALSELSRANLLRPGDEYIHCTQLSPEAWKIIKDTGGVVSLSPPIEMMMGHGMPGIQDALDHGIRPSLSSDVDVTFAQDPFTVMRSTLTLQKLMILQRADRGEKTLPALLTARDVLELATIEGARAAGLADRVGSLKPGKEADIVVLDAGRLNVWPLNNAAGCVVNLMNPINVETVFIAGKVRKWRGTLTGVDEERVRRLAASARDDVIGRAKFEAKLL